MMFVFRFLRYSTPRFVTAEASKVQLAKMKSGKKFRRILECFIIVLSLIGVDEIVLF